MFNIVSRDLGLQVEVTNESGLKLSGRVSVNNEGEIKDFAGNFNKTDENSNEVWDGSLSFTTFSQNKININLNTVNQDSVEDYIDLFNELMTSVKNEVENNDNE